ncbi:uncharacterized protein LOC131258372 isoform X2 [Magnolia sinica]|uniref:uncharacterized protein LOC131258372 isoform X2 n=1 Tax=Magnolia sinica TaxID=86752 RepID=UPI002658CAB1|nr:uncharacterized protein LOC131258372 isoform X2 [Magnolia sinica]
MASQGGAPHTQIQPSSQGYMGSQGDGADIKIEFQFQPTSQGSMGSQVDAAEIHIERAVPMTSENLFEKAMRGDWDYVVEVFEKKPEMQNASLTRSNDTALHIAVSDNKTDVVEKLVEIVKRNPETKLEDMVDGRKDTPLHLAAAQGNIRMCRCMAQNNLNLIKARNKDGETPLFLAVLHGKASAFLYLHGIGQLEPSDIIHCKRNDGDTILHVAIVGGYYDLAYKIIQMFPLLVDYYNAKGNSCLHLLAKHPSSFRSGCNLGPIEQLIYYFANLMPWSTRKKVTEENGPDATRRCAGGSRAWCIRKLKIIDKEISDGKGEGTQMERNGHIKGKLPFPINYITFLKFLELVLELLLVIFGLGFLKVHKIRDKKRKHEWAYKLMEELVRKTSHTDYNNTGGKPDSHNQSTIKRIVSTETEEPNTSPEESKQINLPNNNMKENGNPPIEELVKKILNIASTEKNSAPVEVSKDGQKNAVFVKIGITEPNEYKLIMVMDKENKQEEGKQETPILVAARMGVKEMVQTILKHIPVAIEDVNRDGKNVVLLAVENRQPHVYKFLLDKYSYKERVFHKLDNDGNSALHLAATCGQNRPWRIHGAALQLQWEIKWYKFVKGSMIRHFFTHYNEKGHTPKEVFTKTHAELVNEGSAWLTITSQHCSVVAALIATVAFATAATVPGGVMENKGVPVFEGQLAFDIFAIASLVALCFSVTSLTLFLTILTSRYQEADFGNSLPWRLIIGLTSLFFSIASMLIAFCAGHFFVLKEQLKFAAIPVYVATCIPISIFAIAQFPLYLDLLKSTFTPIPQRTYEITSL